MKKSGNNLFGICCYVARFTFVHIFLFYSIIQGGFIIENPKINTNIEIDEQGHLQNATVQANSTVDPSQDALVITSDNEEKLIVEGNNTIHSVGSFNDNTEDDLFPESGLIFDNAQNSNVFEVNESGDSYIRGRQRTLKATISYAGANIFEYNKTTKLNELSYQNIVTPGGIDGKIAKDNKTYYYVKDHLGSTREVILEDGTLQSASSYHSYGNIIEEFTTSVAARETFTGKEYDMAGGATADDGMKLFYFGARYYDADVGLWTSTDPQEQYWSPYSYVYDPISMIDPNGETGGGEVLLAIVYLIGVTVLINLAIIATTALDYYLDGVEDPWGKAFREHVFFIGIDSDDVNKIKDWNHDHKSPDMDKFYKSANKMKEMEEQLASSEASNFWLSTMQMQEIPAFEMPQLNLGLIEGEGGTGEESGGNVTSEGPTSITGGMEEIYTMRMILPGPQSQIYDLREWAKQYDPPKEKQIPASLVSNNYKIMWEDLKKLDRLKSEFLWMILSDLWEDMGTFSDATTGVSIVPKFVNEIVKNAGRVKSGYQFIESGQAKELIDKIGEYNTKKSKARNPFGPAFYQ